MAAAAITSFAPPVLNNFHFYSACAFSASWNPQWYTEDWFTTSRSYYDSLASLGQVEPPLSVILTEPICSQLSRSIASQSRASLSVQSSLAAASRASISSVSVAATATTSSSPSPASASSLPSVTGSGAGGASATGTGTASGPGPTSTPAVTSNTPLDRPSSDPTCAGDWDSQAKASVATTVWSLLAGILIWLAFALVRGRAAVLYEARRWFSPADDRPLPVHASLLSFFFPPIPLLPSLKTGASSDETLAIQTLFTALKIAFAWTVLSLVTGEQRGKETLPLYLVNVPCGTTIRSRTGGALGSMSDLSLLRLLDAINPPSTSSSSNAARSPLEDFRSFAASDGATTPANAHTRLLILTILVPLVIVLPGLFTALRGFNSLVHHRNKFLHVTCAGLEIGFFPFRPGKGEGLCEERMREVLREGGLMRKHGAISEVEGKVEELTAGAVRSKEEEKKKFREDELKVEVLSVFGVPTTTRLDRLVEQRRIVLDQLEESETRYINSFHIDPIMREDEEENGGDSRPAGDARRASNQGPPTSFVAPSSYYRLKTPNCPSSSAPSPPATTPNSLQGPYQSSSTQPPFPRIESGSRFREIERDSGFFGGKGGKLQVGNRLRPDSSHGLVLDPSPDSENPGYRTSGGFTSGGDSNPTTPGGRAWRGRERERHMREGLSSREDVISSSDDLGRGEASRVMRHRGGSDPTPPPTPGGIPVPRVLVDGSPKATELRQNRGTLSNTSLARLHDPIEAGASSVGHGVKPRQNVTSGELASFYDGIRTSRAELKHLNAEIEEEQAAVFDEMAAGQGIKGFFLLGRGIRFVKGIRLIEGFAKEDIVWKEILKESRMGGKMAMAGFWLLVVSISLALAAAMVPFLALTVADAPGVNEYLGVLRRVAASMNVASVIVEGLVPAIAISLLIVLAVVLINLASRLCGAISETRRRFVVYQAICAVMLVIGGAWLIAASALLFGIETFATGANISQTVADGSIFSSAFFFIFLINLALIAPGLQLLQPVRAWKMLRSLRKGATPRQKFRASRPRIYNSSYGAAVCLLAVFYAATFIVIFPLIGIPVVAILVLSLVALRYTNYYVYLSNGVGNSGGVYALWSLRRFGVILACQPVLFGLILASRDEWSYAIAMFVVAGIALLIVEIFTTWRSYRPSFKSLPAETRRALKNLDRSLLAAAKRLSDGNDGRRESSVSSAHGHARLRSHSSVLDIMARLPGRKAKQHWAIPLRTESIDDLMSTEVAARTHPNAPPHLPPLTFADPAEELRSIIYPPSLLAPPPTIWLPDDESGVGRLEVLELSRYHNLQGIATDLDDPEHPRTTTSQPAR